MEKQTLPNSTGILILGILSIVTCCCYGIIGLPLGIIAIVLANKATKVYNEAPENYNGFSNVSTGKILAIIGVILNILLIGYVIWIISVLGFDILSNPELLQEKLQELQ